MVYGPLVTSSARLSTFSSSSRLEVGQKADDRIQAVSRPILGDLIEGLCKSRIVRAVAFTGISLIGLFLIASNPIGWVVGTVAAGAFVVSLVAQSILDGKGEKIRFEFSAMKWLLKSKRYNEIAWDGKPAGKGRIFLGALPNRIGNQGELLANNSKVQHVLSINDPWEREPLGFWLPYHKGDWEKLGVSYESIDAQDHSFPTFSELLKGARTIHDAVEKGKNIYVHCKAGQGRSAMLIAAYLITYCDKNVDEAANFILNCRKSSTINKKKEYLESYYRSLPSSSNSNVFDPEECYMSLSDLED